MQVDVAADDIIFRRLADSGAVELAASEEKPEPTPLGGRGYSVSFQADLLAYSAL